MEEVRNCSQKIEEIYKTYTLTSSAPSSLGGLQYWQNRCPLQQVGKVMKVISLETAMIFYLQRKKQYISSQSHSSNEYEAIIWAPKKLILRQAITISLTYPLFDDKIIVKEHLVRCTKSWHGQAKWLGIVFFRNKAVRSKATSDAFGKNAVKKVICLFEWDVVYGGLKCHSLALIDKFLLIRLIVGQKNASGEDIAHLKHNVIF
jgi:hypothetical protein